MTLREFIDKVQGLGCQIKNFNITDPTESAWNASWPIVENESGSTTIPDMAPTDHITPTKLRTMVVELHLPPEKFGLTKDDLGSSTIEPCSACDARLDGK